MTLHVDQQALIFSSENFTQNISKIDVVIIALTKVHVDFMDMYM